MPRPARAALLASAVVGLLPLALVAGTGEAAAATYPTSTLTVRSSDDHARGTAHVTWLTSTHVTVSLENCDTYADGRGAILFLYAANGAGGVREVAYDHDLAGNDSCTYFYVELADAKTDVHILTVKECNGGSKSAPQHCDIVRGANPLDG